MIHWNNIPPSERLILWKSFRNSLNNSNSPIEEIAEFFSSVPIGLRSVDYYDSTTWSTPWEILYHGTFCKSSVALMIYYTATLLPGNYNPEVVLINDGTDMYLAVIIGQHLLNYLPAKSILLDDALTDIKIVDRFDSNTIKKI